MDIHQKKNIYIYKATNPLSIFCTAKVICPFSKYKATFAKTKTNQSFLDQPIPLFLCGVIVATNTKCLFMSELDLPKFFITSDVGHKMLIYRLETSLITKCLFVFDGIFQRQSCKTNPRVGVIIR